MAVSSSLFPLNLTHEAVHHGRPSEDWRQQEEGMEECLGAGRSGVFSVENLKIRRLCLSILLSVRVDEMSLPHLTAHSVQTSTVPHLSLPQEAEL